jgi:tRNA U34 2-thiouridine synthase MnmA/TrmU
MKEKMLVSLDGAIESLVTTWLLKKQGFQLRAVLFDVSEAGTDKENMQLRVLEIEKKLGIQVQLVECGQEARDIVFKEIEFGIARGFRYDIKSIFHQKFLFPKLFALKEQYQFQKIASGHRVSLTYEPLEDQMKILRYHTPLQDEAHLLVGLSQEQLRSLVFPLGSIPVAMIQKLATELELKSDLKPAKFEMHYTPQLENAPVYAVDGSYVGMTQDVAKLGLGEQFDQSLIFDINPSRNQVLIGSLEEREIKEVWLESASWFSGEDLGFRLKNCMMSWKAAIQDVPVRVMQYEGGGMKAMLESPISGEHANLFAGDTVTWVEGNVILGGARVIKCL